MFSPWKGYVMPINETVETTIANPYDRFAFESVIARLSGERDAKRDANKLSTAKINRMHLRLIAAGLYHWAVHNNWSGLAQYVRKVKPSGIWLDIVNKCIPVNAKYAVSKGNGGYFVATDGGHFDHESSRAMREFILEIDSVLSETHDPMKSRFADSIKERFARVKPQDAESVAKRLEKLLVSRLKNDVPEDAALSESDLMNIVRAAMAKANKDE